MDDAMRRAITTLAEEMNSPAQVTMDMGCDAADSIAAVLVLGGFREDAIEALWAHASDDCTAQHEQWDRDTDMATYVDTMAARLTGEQSTPVYWRGDGRTAPRTAHVADTGAPIVHLYGRPERGYRTHPARTSVEVATPAAALDLMLGAGNWHEVDAGPAVCTQCSQGHDRGDGFCQRHGKLIPLPTI